MNEDTPVRHPRQLRVRRNNVSRSTQAQGARQDADVADDALDIESPGLNSIVRGQNHPLPEIIPSSLPVLAPVEPRPMLEKLRRIGRASSEYEREYRLRLLHSMLMQGTPLDDIAGELGISVSQVIRDRSELAKRLREESRDLDIDFLVGENSQVYNEAQAMALRIANSNVPAATRLAALRTALGANADKHRFLTTAGVYDALRFRRSGEVAEKSDLAKLMEITERLFAPPPSDSGVGGLSLEDNDSNSSSDEIIDL